MASNPVLDINGRTAERLRIALELTEERTAVGYSVHNDRLVLFRYAREGIIAFPAPLSMADLVPIITAWLAAATYPREPDHDGDNVKGWRVARGLWGRAEGYDNHASFVSIRPEWIQYGK